MTFSLTAHYVDQSFRRVFKVLCTEPIFEAQTGINIAALINKILLEFSLPPEKVHLILRDACTAMICALDLTEYDHMDCFIHKIQLV